MGQQQILLIVLSVILVGIAVAVGITMFKGYSESAAQDAIVLDIMNISTLAYQHRMRPAIMGGGNGKYTSFELPANFASNANGEYEIEVIDNIDGPGSVLKVTGTSNTYENATITAYYDLSLNLIDPESGTGDGSTGTTTTSGFVKDGWDQ